MVLRYAVLSATLLAACCTAGSRLLVREPADPCVATPGIHACAMFLQPERLIRHAGPGRAGPTRHDGPRIATGAITVSDGTATLAETARAQEAGL